MAKDRVFFFLSFAILGLIAAFLFRAPEQKPAPKETPTEAIAAPTEKNAIEVLVSKEPLKAYDHFTDNNYTWKKIAVSEFNNSFILKTPEVEKLLPNALAAKEIPKDTKISRSDIFWPLDEAKNPQKEMLEIHPGRRAVPFQITKRFGLVQFLKPGIFVDLTFNASAESGFGAVSLTLLKNIQILAVENDQDSSKLGTRNRPDSPLEVLLEMTPQEADIFSYALSSGEVSLTFLNKPEQEQDALAEELFHSESLDDFRSILVTHTMRSFFPQENISVKVVPKGYVLSGEVSNPKKIDKIVDLLSKFSPDGNKSIVNLIEAPPEPEAAPPPKEESLEPAFIPPEKGRIPVLLEAPQISGFLSFLEPGMCVDIAFHSKPDLGFGSVNVNLFQNIRVLGIEKERTKMIPEHAKMQGPLPPPLTRFFLEMTPKDAEIFHYAEGAGILSLNLIDENSPPQNSTLADSLLSSNSFDEFRSRLITAMVRDLFPLVDVNIISTSKGFVVEGHVSDQQKADKIMEILQKLAPVEEKSIVNLLEVEPQQVLINVKVMEVDTNVKGNLGLNWQVLFNHNATSAAFAAVTAPVAPFTPNFFASGNQIQSGNFTLSALINMLEEDSNTKVLAEPNLTTTSGKTAHFFAGGEFPILIPQGGTLIGTVTVEYKKYGVLLDFTPSVDINGLITMQIVPEISTIDKANSVVLSGYILPGLVSRRVETTVKLWPGQSYVIAGLLQNEIRQIDDNLYGLNRLPIIGPLFSSKSFENLETELMVVITPFLISSERANIHKENACIPVPCKRCGKFHPPRHPILP